MPFISHILTAKLTAIHYGGSGHVCQAARHLHNKVVSRLAWPHFHDTNEHVLISPIHFLFLIAHRATGALSKCSPEIPPQTPGLLI